MRASPVLSRYVVDDQYSSGLNAREKMTCRQHRGTSVLIDQGFPFFLAGQPPLPGNRSITETTGLHSPSPAPKPLLQTSL